MVTTIYNWHLRIFLCKSPVIFFVVSNACRCTGWDFSYFHFKYRCLSVRERAFFLLLTNSSEVEEKRKNRRTPNSSFRFQLFFGVCLEIAMETWNMTTSERPLIGEEMLSDWHRKSMMKKNTSMCHVSFMQTESHHSPACVAHVLLLPPPPSHSMSSSSQSLSVKAVFFSSLFVDCRCWILMPLSDCGVVVPVSIENGR